MTTCNICDAFNAQSHLFCFQCGSKLGPGHWDSLSQGERRQLTVMFCDLAGSTILAEQLDPEDWLHVLRSYQQVCEEVTSHYDGHIAKYIGDGVLIYYGHPVAHEDGPRRAVANGLGIVKAVEDLNARIAWQYNARLQVRIGIHTGKVVIGQVGAGSAREENAIVGETPNIAARLQSTAPHGSVVISDTTHRLVQGLFTLEDLGLHNLKGVSRQIAVSRVISENEYETSFVVKARQGLTPIVAREAELSRLHRLWEKTISGIGCTLVIEGEPGIGKSRLLEALKSDLRQRPEKSRRINYFCSSCHTNTAFFPLIAAATQEIQQLHSPGNLTRYQKLELYLTQSGIPKAHTPAFASSLSIEFPRGLDNPFNPDETKQLLSRDWLNLLQSLSAHSPLLVTFEDTHWLDPSTAELIDKLSALTCRIPVMLVITKRLCQGTLPFSGQGFERMVLSRLDNSNNQQLVNVITGDTKLPADLVQYIVDRTDGVPLYIEEFTKAILESGAANPENINQAGDSKSAAIAIPDSLQDSLMSRLDRMSTVKQIVQVAATIGRRFTKKLLSEVSGYSESFLDDALSRLVSAQIIYPLENLGVATFEFKHALIQDTAYQSLLKTAQREYHDRIARTLEVAADFQWEAHPEILAYHFTEAQNTKKAIHYWLQAGQRASETSSHLEAVAHLEKGLAMLHSLPQNPQRDRMEIEMLVCHIGPLMIARGYTSPESEKAVNRAVELSRRIENCPQIFKILGARHQFLQASGQIRRAEKVGNQFMALAREQGQDDMLLIANRVQGTDRFLAGDSLSSLGYWETVSALYDVKKHHSLAFVYGQDLNVHSLSYQSLAFWHCGRTVHAIRSFEQAIKAAEQLGHPNTICVALFCGAMTSALIDDSNRTLTLCNNLISLCEKRSIPLWLSVGNILLGWAKCEQGNEQAAMEHISRGFTSYEAMNLGLFRPLMSILRSRTYVRCNRADEAIPDLEKSIASQIASGELWLASLSYCALGDLYQHRTASNIPGAKKVWQRALDLAIAQQSPTQEKLATDRLHAVN